MISHKIAVHQLIDVCTIRVVHVHISCWTSVKRLVSLIASLWHNIAAYHAHRGTEFSFHTLIVDYVHTMVVVKGE